MRQKVWKNSEKIWKKDRKKFGKISEKVRKFRKLGISELSETYEKMTFNSKFENHEKLVPTRKFGKKFGMQGLTCHTLFCTSLNRNAICPNERNYDDHNPEWPIKSFEFLFAFVI